MSNDELWLFRLVMKTPPSATVVLCDVMCRVGQELVEIVNCSNIYSLKGRDILYVILLVENKFNNQQKGVQYPHRRVNENIILGLLPY